MPRRRPYIAAAYAIACATFSVIGLTAAVLPAGAHAGSAGSARGSAAARLQNPVSDGYSIDFPDPSIVRAPDGWWYAYATGGPYDETGRSDPSKMARSKDLLHWQSLGPIFTAATQPTWATSTSATWAPDVRYVNGVWTMYFVIPDTTVSAQGFDPGIGVATAPSPAGPWTDSGAPLIAPRTNAAGNYTTVIDPAQFTDVDGTRYLYYGGFDSGDYVVKLSADGKQVTGPATKIASERFEGPYVVRHGDWYYLFQSSANCCAGPTTGYTVFTGRATSPLGPFRDRNGVALTASRSGGSVVIAPNGNRFVGTGHNAMLTDLSGQTYLAYHAVDRTHPYLDTTPGFTMRPFLLDRLDWIDGWPTVRGGQGASDSPQPAPVTTGLVNTGDLPTGSGTRVVNRKVPGDVRVEATVRSGSTPSGVVLRWNSTRDNVQAIVDGARHRVSVIVTEHGRRTTQSWHVAGSIDLTKWHNLAVEARGRTLSVQLTDARLADPQVDAQVRLPASLSGGRVGTVGRPASFSAAALFTPHTAMAPVPGRGALIRSSSDEFTDGVGKGWTWRNFDAGTRVAGGALQWPTDVYDISGDTASKAALLLRQPPKGDYVVETKLTFDVGINTIRNYQQAGLVVYLDDLHWLRLDHVAAGPVRFVEFGKRDVVDGVTSFGGAIIGPPATTTWLRIAKSVDASTGEQRYRAGSSPDGVHWTWGGTWTLPAGSQPRIGLLSQGSSAAVEAQYGKATAQFDYVRFYRPAD